MDTKFKIQVIKEVKKGKKNFVAVWLDLLNADGSVPYTLIEYAMEFYNILDKGLSGATLEK